MDSINNLKPLTFFGDYTPEEQTSIFTAFDRFNNPDWYFRYLHLPRWINLPIAERMQLLKSNQVGIVRVPEEFFLDTEADNFITLSDVIDEQQIPNSPNRNSFHRISYCIANHILINIGVSASLLYTSERSSGQ